MKAKLVLFAVCLMSVGLGQWLGTAVTMPTAQVSVYQTRLDTLSPLRLHNVEGTIWMNEGHWSGPNPYSSNIVRICPGVPPDSVIEVTPTSSTVIPTSYALRLFGQDTVLPRRTVIHPLSRPIVRESTGAFVRYRLPGNGWCLDFCHAGRFYFTDWEANRVGLMDTQAMVVREWALPTLEAHPVGLVASGDTLFFVETGADVLGRLVAAENEVTEWSLNAWGTLRGIVLDSSGNIWVAQPYSHLLTRVRIEADDAVVLGSYEVPYITSSGPTELLVAPGMGMWFCADEYSSGRSKVGYVDLRTMHCRQWTLPEDTMRAYHITADRFGNAWFGDDLTSLLSLAPSTNTMTWYPALYPETWPQGTSGFAVDDSGDLWMTSSYGQVFRYRNVVVGVAAGSAPAAPAPGLAAFPNPFRKRVRFCGAPTAVYDRAGKLVARLSGPSWDGRAADGDEVRPGVYFARFPSGQQLKLTKLQ